jgi:hypothetical protein
MHGGRRVCRAVRKLPLTLRGGVCVLWVVLCVWRVCVLCSVVLCVWRVCCVRVCVLYFVLCVARVCVLCCVVCVACGCCVVCVCGACVLCCVCGAFVWRVQMFFDVPLFFKFVADCRAIGITVPIVPGIMVIQAYAGFKRMTAFCKARVPKVRGGVGGWGGMRGGVAGQGGWWRWIGWLCGGR